MSDAAVSVLGIGGVLLTQRSVAHSLRGVTVSKRAAKSREASQAASPSGWEEAPAGPALTGLGMTGKAPGFLPSVASVARAELRELVRQPGLYIFVPLILIQVLGSSLLAVGACFRSALR